MARAVCCSSPKKSTTVILFWVRVPVLSEQMTWAQPRVSTAVRRRMTALRLDMLVTPMESTMVTTVARPSGMAATARDTATMKVLMMVSRWKSPALQQAEGEDEHADAQHQHAEDAAELAQLALQGGLAVLGLGQGVGDLAHLRVHAGGADHRPAPAVDHGGAHIDHALAVAQGDIPLLRDGGGLLLHRHALAGEGGLLGLEAGALQDAAVGGHGVAGLQDHHVAGHQLLALEEDHLPVPQHLAGGGGHLLEGLDGLLRLALLVHAQHGVDDHHDEDDEHIREALAGVGGGDAGHQGRHQENDDHGVAELLEEALEQGDLLPLGQLVGAILLQPAAGLLACQPGLRALQVLQYPVGGLLVEIHCFITLPFLFVMW